MNVNIKTTLLSTVRRITSFWRGPITSGSSPDSAEFEAPLRAELFSADQMERHGKTLADAHKLSAAKGPDKLLLRLVDNEAVLLDACQLLRSAVRSSRRITPAGEWLLDNFYLIEEQIRTARRHFPKGYSRELPLLAHGASAGFPRVYDIALEAVAHGDGRLDPENLNRFVAAYQKVADLKLGELWAIPIMLRLALIENLRRVAARVAAGMLDRNLADEWADQMLDVAEKDPKSLIIVIADMARSNPPLVNSFVAELSRRLQGHSAALALPLTWVEQRLFEMGLTIEQLVQSETNSQAANQVSISNSIGSLRFLVAMDWRDFVEAMSAVELKLREDPGGVYGTMDFSSRDHYRHAIERTARWGGLVESDVARKAVQLAHEGWQAATEGGDLRAGHVGFYLIDRGRPQLERALELRPGDIEFLRRLVRRFPLPWYLGGVGLLTVLVAGLFGRWVSAADLPGWQQALLLAPLLLVASQLAVTLVNWAVTLLVQPHALPRLDFSNGIPASARTLVVVPSLLTSLDNVDGLAEALEVRYLANQDAHLHFGLLTDFRDAASASVPADEALLQRAFERIEALNVKYGGPSQDTFFLFHRPRAWNSREGAWMGYERKRGKLGALNAFLRTGVTAAFSLIVGETAALRQVRYVITLDADTALPRDAASQFAATMAHPLNQPRYDATLGRVVAGYGILQPRVAVSLPSTNRSRYAKLFGSEPGLDPYTRAVSDVYQDFFGEGSFIGKGIYDVDVFEQALSERFPDNRILSHDLLEGCYARSGLVSDVQLYEDFPATYLGDVRRRQRWVRGDWQIAAWLLRRVPEGAVPCKPGQGNPLTALSQWKVFDNLRRSLVPAGVLGLLLAGWLAAPFALAWTLCTVAILLVPAGAAVGLDVLRKPADVPMGAHLRGALASIVRQLTQAILNLACLPFEVAFNLDAIVRTSLRVLATHRHLLEWQASADQPVEGLTLGSVWLRMWSSTGTALLVASLLCLLKPGVLAVAAPVLALWLLSPVFVWWVGLPLTRHASTLRPTQAVFLHKLARKTWSFFETFVTEKDHWLPPDNYQEHPVEVVAHRTSPTNMGLALLANLTACDFGYIGIGELVERTGNALRSMQRLERHQGHFYNWYDTLTLKPLAPLYISSVDSGNLAGHLLTLRPGLLALQDQSVLAARALDAMNDTLALVTDAFEHAGPSESKQALVQLRHELEAVYDSRPATVAAVHQGLSRMARLSAQLAGSDTDGATASAEPEWKRWAEALARQCQTAADDLACMVPWCHLPPVPAWLHDLSAFGGLPSLRELSVLAASLAQRVLSRRDSDVRPEDDECLVQLQPLILLAEVRAKARIAEIESLALLAGQLAAVDYSFLYDSSRHLMTVGYNVDQGRRDTGQYDLLASEVRLASFVAIAQGEVPQENWFALGRRLTSVGGHAVLLSWSGSMFEYLMPLLVMPTYENTLLDQTCRAAVKHQIAYGKLCGVPWGVSESGYNTVDANLNYQYRAFGVPGLGLKRGLADDLVVAPYASALALMVDADASCQNLKRLTAEGLQGRYGMYEAMDYTPLRVPRGQTGVVVRSFMAHHQGMSLLALAYVLLDQPMQKRFASDPLFQATVLLLQERIPVATMLPVHRPELSDVHAASLGPEMPMRVLRSPDTPAPEVQLLSNGRYHVMVTHAGGGYSRWKDFAVTRWREDSTRDDWGAFLYLRDSMSGEFWSAAHQPVLRKADSYEAIFSEGRAEFRRRDHDYETHTEIVVSPEDDIELRRTHITNRSRSRRAIEVTSYAEVVLATPAADALHPAFSNLFVQTEVIDALGAIVCTRRPRADAEQVPWMFHLMAVHGGASTQVSYETDRLRFIGRTRGLDAPLVMVEPAPLSGSQGSVLDPVVAIRHLITLDPRQSVTIDVVTGAADNRDQVLVLAGKYRDRHLADRVFDLAWTHSWVNLRQINATESDAQLYGRLAGAIIYANQVLRSEPAVLARNRRGQSALWSYAISGDLPIVLLQIGDAANIELVRQMVQAHAYWRLKGLAVDLVIWNEDHAGYRQVLQEQITGLIAAGVEANFAERPGGIFLRVAEQISAEDRTLFLAVARVIISDRQGALADQVNRRLPKEAREPPLLGGRTLALQPAVADVKYAAFPPVQALLFYNGKGGFSKDGREYVMTTEPGCTTPAPWVNVIANAHFGTVISESGSAYTWSENAHEFRLTPWSNDPVSDRSGEVIYLRDEDGGEFWSATPLPCGGRTPYVTRHGFGYSVFSHDEMGIQSELTVFVDTVEAVKFSVLKVRNQSGRLRRLSATGYVEWVLGDMRPKSSMHVMTEIDAATGALCARNRYSTAFFDRVVFFDADGATREAGVSSTGDRREFLGRNGSLQNPAAMKRSRLSNRVGAGLDPCAALQVPFDLAHGQERVIVFRLGAATLGGSDNISEVIQRLRWPDAAVKSLDLVHAYWRDTLGAVQVETPDAAVNILCNGWLIYQTLACRLWARTGFYQSGGAYGFRDQLQDSMALVHAEPRLVREHLLRCAARQFPQGDVQHWWHPPQGRGVRTHCSDDYLWLPQAVCRYVEVTGDTGVLDEAVHFIEGRPVNAEDDSYYDLPTHSEAKASLYEHCARSVRHGMRLGAHGLPLMGSGDWNDGMNLVGMQGKGESVWLGFFLFDTLQRFGVLAAARHDNETQSLCIAQAAELRRNLDQHAWDGHWYRRAYFDDGTPLGSASNAECQIDAIAQSWSVLSGAGDPVRSREAMGALDSHLVNREHGLIKLLEPPFNTSPLNPGYIKGYVPGVRENGGQYTHSAIWSIMAFAGIGDGERAWDLFNMINPIHHSSSDGGASTYRVEPYVMAADVYAVSPHQGRGGWTWYTGAAGWTYRLLLESLLGLEINGDRLRVKPCMPAGWTGYTLRYRHQQTLYVIAVNRVGADQGCADVMLDGVRQEVGGIKLLNDFGVHSVVIAVLSRVP